MMIYNTAAGTNQQYVWGAWVDVDTGTAVANASETVAGKVEIATTAEHDAGTDTGGTGAQLVSKPSDIQDSLDQNVADAASATPDVTADFVPFGDVSDWFSRKRRRIDLFLDDCAASTTQKGTVELATDTECDTGTDETRYVNPKQLRDYSRTYSYAVSDNLVNSSDTEVSHASSVWTKKKSTQVLYPWNYRVKFSVRWNTTDNADHRAQIYINGVATGTERRPESTTYVEYSEDFTNLKAWDTIEVWLYGDNSPVRWTYCENFRIYGDRTAIGDFYNDL